MIYFNLSLKNICNLKAFFPPDFNANTFACGGREKTFSLVAPYFFWKKKFPFFGRSNNVHGKKFKSYQKIL